LDQGQDVLKSFLWFPQSLQANAGKVFKISIKRGPCKQVAQRLETKQLITSRACDVDKGRIRLMVFENRVLRRIFGSKREEVTGGFQVIKSRQEMRWVGH
jgi:hypothetical protein